MHLFLTWLVNALQEYSHTTFTQNSSVFIFIFAEFFYQIAICSLPISFLDISTRIDPSIFTSIAPEVLDQSNKTSWVFPALNQQATSCPSPVSRRKRMKDRINSGIFRGFCKLVYHFGCPNYVLKLIRNS